MAAVAKSSTPSDGRIPCPQCGGLVHPIAGKCKHCKADLAEARGARPQAAATLPALAGSGKAPPVRPDATPVPALPSPAKAIATAAAEPAPILPPRTTGRMPAAGAPKGSLLRNWPVIVIVLAGLAIAAAVVIMVWPPSKDAKADTRLPPPPAPERMSTDPLAPQGSIVPPSAPKAPAAPSAPDPWGQRKPDDQASIDPQDPLADPMRAFGGASGLGSNFNPGMVFAMGEHLCSRAAACGDTDVAPFCAMMKLAPTPAPTCAAVQECLAQIDQMDCNASFQLDNPADLMGMAQRWTPCVQALSC